jgi:hypothetical protein
VDDRADLPVLVAESGQFRFFTPEDDSTVTCGCVHTGVMDEKWYDTNMRVVIRWIAALVLMAIFAVALTLALNLANIHHGPPVVAVLIAAGCGDAARRVSRFIAPDLARLILRR